MEINDNSQTSFYYFENDNINEVVEAVYEIKKECEEEKGCEEEGCNGYNERCKGRKRQKIVITGKIIIKKDLVAMEEIYSNVQVELSSKHNTKAYFTTTGALQIPCLINDDDSCDKNIITIRVPYVKGSFLVDVYSVCQSRNFRCLAFSSNKDEILQKYLKKVKINMILLKTRLPEDLVRKLVTLYLN